MSKSVNWRRQPIMKKLWRHPVGCGKGANWIVRETRLPEADANDLVLILVRLANQTCHKMGIGLKDASSIVLHATPEANQLQLV